MSDFNFTENWPIEKSKNRIKEIQKDIDDANVEISRIDKELEGTKNRLLKKKKKLAKKISHNQKYKNALINDVYRKEN